MEFNDVQIADIARVCHEANRAYCQSLGDTSQAAWGNAPQWQKDSAIRGVKLHLGGDHPAEASHVSWMKQKTDEGWKYGKTKDADAKTHPCIMPFSELPVEQQRKDHLFRAIVHAFKA